MILYLLLNRGFLMIAGDNWAALAGWVSFMHGRPQMMQLFLLFVVQEVVLLFLFALVFKRWKWSWNIWKYFRERFKRKGWWSVFKRSIAGIIVYMFGSAVLLGALQRFGITIPWLFGEEMVMTMLSGITLNARYDYALLILLAVVIGPVVEEVVFRWFVTDRLVAARSGSGLVIASILFSVAHMERGVVINLTILAVFLGYIYRKTDSLRYSLLFHMGINGLAVAALIATKLYPTLMVAS